MKSELDEHRWVAGNLESGDAKVTRATENRGLLRGQCREGNGPYIVMSKIYESHTGRQCI